MNKMVWLLMLVITSAIADENFAASQSTHIAMGDIGAIKSTLNEESSANAPVQSWAQLTDEQRKQAILGSQMRDLVLGPGHDGETIQPEGLKTSTLNEGQRKLLLELIAEWSGIIHDVAAAAKMNEIKANLADTWFAWSGPLETGKAYFRIQGPTVFIEYAPQKLGGDVTMHIHSMFRDPTNDYGKKFAGK